VIAGLVGALLCVTSLKFHQNLWHKQTIIDSLRCSVALLAWSYV